MNLISFQKNNLLLFFFLLPSLFFAQSSSIIGSATINEYAYGVCADNAGNVYFGATTNNDSWIFKRDVNNNIVWSKQLNTVAAGFSSDVSYIDIVGDTIFGCGWLKSGTTIEGSLLFKLNASTGQQYWVKSEATSNTYFTSMKYANGKYFASGSQMNNAAGYNGKVMALSSANGSIIWQTPAIGIMFPGFGNDYIDDFYSSTEMVNGKMFITGRSYVNATPNNMRTILIGVSDVGTIFLAKYLEFNTAIAGDSRFYGISIEYDGPDSLVVLQYGDDNCSSCTDNKASLIKTDLNGVVSWCKQYDINGISLEVGRGLNITPTSYVFYGYANLNQTNSKMFAIKTDKLGVFQVAKLISLGTGNLGHISGPINCGGSSNFKNGKHYIPGSYFTTNINSRDIAQIVLNENLEDPQSCLTLTPATVVTNTFPPFSNVLNLNTPADLMNFNILPTAIQCTYISPCNATVSFSQNANCDSSVITASVNTINNPTFMWSNGHVGNTTTVYNNDTLFVYVSNPVTCCIVVDTIIPSLSSPNFSAQLPNDTTLCLNQPGSYNLVPTLSPSTGTYTYLWSNQSQNSSLNVTQSGTYWVSVSNGCNVAIDSIHIVINPIPQLTSMLLDTICSQENVNLNLTSSIPASFSWYAINNPSISGETTSPSNNTSIQDILVNTGSTSQNVSYPITVTAGNCSSTQTFVVNVQPALNAPIITPSGALTFCNGGSVTLTSNFPSGNTWSTGESSQSITVSSSGTINLTVGTTYCNSPTTSIQVIELASSPPTAQLSGGGIYCQGQSITPISVDFSGTGPWTLSYELNGVPQTTIISNATNYNLGQIPGTYIITSVQDVNCVNTLPDTAIILIHPIPTVTVNPITICSGSSGNLLAQVSATGGSYLWSPNGETTNSISVSPTINSNYTVVYTLNNCPSAPATAVVSVNPLPTVTFIADTLIGCVPLTVNFQSTSISDPNACVWTLSNGMTLTGCNPSYTFNQAGCYDVSLTSTLNGCSASATSTQYICIENNPTAFFTANPLVLNQANSSIHFFNQSSGASFYAWDFGDGQQSTVFNPEHTYALNGGDVSVTLVATSQLGCTASYTLNILYEEDLIFYVPNSFTPDGDQFNQVFLPIFSSGIDLSSYHLSIYDRWGELIFESYDSEIGWDGTYQMIQGLVEDGIYIWKLDFKLKKNDNRKVFTGHVNVLR